MINTKPASQLSIWVREEGHVSMVRVSPHVPLVCVLFTIFRNGELACRLSTTCRHIQYSDAIHTTEVTQDFLYLFICYGYVRLDPFPCINSLFWFQSVTVRDVNSFPFSLPVASPGNVV